MSVLYGVFKELSKHKLAGVVLRHVSSLFTVVVLLSCGMRQHHTGCSIVAL